jgi:GTPase SAR1 family protein
MAQNFKILVLGDGAVGKTTLIRKLSLGYFTETYARMRREKE